MGVMLQYMWDRLSKVNTKRRTSNHPNNFDK